MSVNYFRKENAVEIIDPKLFRCSANLFSPITINVSKYITAPTFTRQATIANEKRPVHPIPSNNLRTTHRPKKNTPTFKKGMSLDHSSVNYHQFKMMERIENFLKMSK